MKLAAQYSRTLPSVFEQHIIIDQDRRAHSEGKIAISLNYKAAHDPYLSVTLNKSLAALDKIISVAVLILTTILKIKSVESFALYTYLF